MNPKFPAFTDSIEVYETFLNCTDSVIDDAKKRNLILRNLLLKSNHKFIEKITELKKKSAFITEYQHYEILCSFISSRRGRSIDYLNENTHFCYGVFNFMKNQLKTPIATGKYEHKFIYKALVCLLKNSVMFPSAILSIVDIEPEIMKICYKKLLKYSGRFLVRVGIQNIISEYANLYQSARKVLTLVQPNSYYVSSKNQINFISVKPGLFVTDTIFYNFKSKIPLITRKTVPLLKIGELEPKQQYKLYLIAKNAPGVFVDINRSDFRKNNDVNYEFYIPIGVELLIYGIDRLKTGTRKLYKKIRKSQIYDPQIYRVISQFTYGTDKSNYFYKKTQYLS